MGKGVGKLSNWYSIISSGVIFIEFFNLRLGRAKFFANQVSSKLPVPISIVTSKQKTVQISKARRTNSKHSFFW